ncbi:MAG TPA: MotA/TolQ/ExbB proton channel family protein [Thermoanaerobaculia bacterium]|jgi:biopolymer transport protein ExbB/biopolymer transport protein TolQ|nr:MotA/TolQ/ExbB proton channel family protein [Thermoanaerobaculia bacterium]
MHEAKFLSSLGLAEMSAIGVAVVFTLVLLSILSLSVSAERLITFRRARRQSLEFARILAQKPEREQEDWLREAVEAAGRFPHSHLARVVSAGLLTWQQKSARGSLPAEAVIEASARAVERSSMVTLARFKRGIGTLATIATISPFVGLFGTVVGIIHAFRAIAGNGGAGGFSTVSSGIAEALVTTALGILVAIPAAWMFNYLTERIERLRVEMESSSAELMEFFLEMGE